MNTTGTQTTSPSLVQINLILFLRHRAYKFYTNKINRTMINFQGNVLNFLTTKTLMYSINLHQNPCNLYFLTIRARELRICTVALKWNKVIIANFSISKFEPKYYEWIAKLKSTMSFWYSNYLFTPFEFVLYMYMLCNCWK